MANREMDAAAEVAAKELEQLDQGAVKAVATWWSQHYLHAGHRRLARRLMDKVNSDDLEEIKDLMKD